MLTYISSLNDPKKGALKEWNDEGGGIPEGDVWKREGLDLNA
jgi:hypothetical protein